MSYGIDSIIEECLMTQIVSRVSCSVFRTSGSNAFETRDTKHQTPAHAISVLVVLLCLAACGCSAKPAAAKRYHLEGKVISIDKPLHQAMIQHKDIPGFMGAMTMAYTVPNDQDFDKLSAGESITATVVASDVKIFLEDVRVVKPASTDASH
ncbi:MAG: copper-binding protein [Terriglobales bacterium]